MKQHKQLAYRIWLPVGFSRPLSWQETFVIISESEKVSASVGFPELSPTAVGIQTVLKTTELQQCLGTVLRERPQRLQDDYQLTDMVLNWLP